MKGWDTQNGKEPSKEGNEEYGAGAGADGGSRMRRFMD